VTTATSGFNIDEKERFIVIADELLTIYWPNGAQSVQPSSPNFHHVKFRINLQDDFYSRYTSALKTDDAVPPNILPSSIWPNTGAFYMMLKTSIPQASDDLDPDNLYYIDCEGSARFVYTVTSMSKMRY